MSKKFRIACVFNFPKDDPLYVHFDTLDKAKEVLTGFKERGTFQVPNFPLPGKPSYAQIEILDETDGEWTVYVE